MLNKLLKPGYIRIAVIAVAAAAVIAAVMLSVHTVRSTEVSIVTDKDIDITPEQIESIKAIGEWEFLSVSYEELVDTIRHGFFSDSRLSRIYNGTLRLGINMHHVEPGWIRVSGDTVTLRLPPVGLLDNDFIDEARTRPFHESGRWTAADREELYMRAHRKMKLRGLTAANIRIAQDNADAQLRKMMHAMGFGTVIIRFGK